MVKRNKRNPMKDFKYEDNLADKDLNVSLIADRLLDLVGEDLVDQFNNLSFGDKKGEIFRVVEGESDTACSTPCTRMKQS